MLCCEGIEHYTITLVPKVKFSNYVSEFRLIASTIYECLTKLIRAKLNVVLSKVISITQGAFVASGNIMHNVLLCQELVKMYRPTQK